MLDPGHHVGVAVRVGDLHGIAVHSNSVVADSTGQQQRILDIEGQVDRFYKRLQARQDYVETVKARETVRTSPTRAIAELGLGTRPTDALAKAGLATVGQVIEKLQGGEAALLEVEGFGRKSLIDLKKRLRQLGYALPAAAEDVAV